MAAGSLLALIDDIATILDDVALLTKVAAKKTAGVVGDDLALNAQQVTGVSAERELPVVWAVAKGSFVNKLILVPSALLISAVAPVLVIPLLMVGGIYLCYEGFEKIVHRRKPGRLPADPAVDLVELEKDKIKGAIRTDFILSAEIVVISLGTVAEADFVTRVGVLSGIAILMTVGVYGLVAGIVKLDDAGIHLSRKSSRSARALGAAILRVAPWLMKGLSVAGTAAMFLVGGGILVHGIPLLHHWVEDAGWLATGAVGAATGIAAGALALAAVRLAQAMIRRWDRSRA